MRVRDDYTFVVVWAALIGLVVVARVVAGAAGLGIP